MEGIELMAQGHILAGFNAGLTEPELRGLMSVIKDSIGKERAEIGNHLLDNATAIHENRLND